jgi:hypothetical protein
VSAAINCPSAVAWMVKNSVVLYPGFMDDDFTPTRATRQVGPQALRSSRPVARCAC